VDGRDVSADGLVLDNHDEAIRSLNARVLAIELKLKIDGRTELL
jgi:hypothetical protein